MVGTTQALIGLASVVAVVALVAWPVLKVRENLENNLEKEMGAIATEVGAAEEQQVGYVLINTPVYLGIFVGLTEYATGWWVPSLKVRYVSQRLSVLSLKYGLYTLFFPYVLILVLTNYLSNLRKSVPAL